ncbi:hypothetical protein EYF80_031028 [Liparis tanakae]|uniref:Uncharacterized protein n=1 Tax=Liparis tanakae TaxID=230148 RepID=A0A4Z2H132_9TELE|nr:hypothetical protein EYF80_031028 [Liparis tanakae]
MKTTRQDSSRGDRSLVCEGGGAPLLAVHCPTQSLDTELCCGRCAHIRTQRDAPRRCGASLWNTSAAQLTFLSPTRHMPIPTDHRSAAPPPSVQTGRRSGRTAR